jgi:hypothetical protein
MVVAAQATPLDKKAALRHMEKTNPETLALAYDWEDIAAKVVCTQEKIKECVMDLVYNPPFNLGPFRLSSNEPDPQALGMIHLHNRTSSFLDAGVKYSSTPQRHFLRTPRRSLSICTSEQANLTRSVLNSSALTRYLHDSFSSSRRSPHWRS